MHSIRKFCSRNRAEIRLIVVLVLAMVGFFACLILTKDTQASSKKDSSPTGRGITADAVYIGSHALDNKSTAGIVGDFTRITARATSRAGQNGVQLMADIAENVGVPTTDIEVSADAVDELQTITASEKALAASMLYNEAYDPVQEDAQRAEAIFAEHERNRKLVRSEIMALSDDEFGEAAKDVLIGVIFDHEDLPSRDWLDAFSERIGFPLWIRQLMARVLYNEANNVESEAERSMVVWTMMNRYDGDSWYGGDMYTILSKPGQYSFDDPRHNVITERNLLLVEDVIIRWWLEKQGVQNVGRTLPADVMFFLTDFQSPGWHNYFYKLSDGLNGYKIIFDRNHPLSNPYGS